jgi:hypothetical protein
MQRAAVPRAPEGLEEPPLDSATMTRQERVVAPHHHLTRPSAQFIPSSSERWDSGPLTIPIVAETDHFARPSANDRYFADIVEKLEFLRRSQFRGPPEASTEYSLGVRLSDRSCHVRRSNRRCCGNYRRRQHYMRSSEIFPAPQFPSFSTVSCAQRTAGVGRGLRPRGGKHTLPSLRRAPSCSPEKRLRLQPNRQDVG